MGISPNGEYVVVASEPQSHDLETISRVRGVLLFDTCGKREEYSLEGVSRKERTKRKKERVLLGWAKSFVRNAKGNASLFTFLREESATYFFPASQELREKIFGKQEPVFVRDKHPVTWTEWWKRRPEDRRFFG